MKHIAVACPRQRSPLVPTRAVHPFRRSLGRALAAALCLCLAAGLAGGCRKRGTTAAPGAAEPEQKARKGKAGGGTISQALEALLETPNPDKRARVAERIAQAPAEEKVRLKGDEMIAVGISADGWTMDGKPAGVLVTNPGDDELALQLRIASYSPPDQMPKTIIDDGAERKEIVHEATGEKMVALAPVPPRSTRLFIVTTDRTWQPAPPDSRQLGVQILPLDGAPAS